MQRCRAIDHLFAAVVGAQDEHRPVVVEEQLHYRGERVAVRRKLEEAVDIVELPANLS